MLEAQASFDGYGDKYLPVEVQPDIFDAIRAGTDKGVVIIEAGANGWNDLDQFKDRNGKQILNRNSKDFKDSGAIMVGAGALHLSLINVCGFRIMEAVLMCTDGEKM